MYENYGSNRWVQKGGFKKTVEIDGSKWTGQNRLVQIDRFK